MKFSPILILCLIAGNNLATAQCDSDIEKKLDKNAGKYIVLKRTEMKMKTIENVPFSFQSSYVFTKGNVYAIHLEYALEATNELAFTLSDNNGEVLNSYLEKLPSLGQQAWSFTCPATGIYYLNFHAPQSFTACAAFQLLKIKTNSDKKILPCSDDKQGKALQGFAYLKTFRVDNLQDYEYSYVFSKGKFYHFMLSSEDVELTVLNENKMEIIPYAIKRDKNGVEIGFDSKVTGIVYIRLKTEVECSSINLHFKNKS